MRKPLIIMLLGIFLLLSLQKKPNKNHNNSTQSNIIEILRTASGDIVEIEFEDYIKGVVFAEMPASFNFETLKAQSVAARTYAIRNISDKISLCDNPAHCQAWKEANESENYKKISDAVDATKGEILTYNDKPILAVFHSASGGNTENVKEVWGSSLPYLISVSSPNEEIMPNFLSEKRVTYSEFSKKLNSYLNEKNAITSNKKTLRKQIKITRFTEGGRVLELKVCGKTLSGIEIRSIFNLRSSNFSINLDDETIIFSVKGYGHGVGMSQWGAETMARAGSTYKEILSHYYPDATLTNSLTMGTGQNVKSPQMISTKVFK